MGRIKLPIAYREAQLFVGWVSGSVTHAGVGFHSSTQPTFILYLIPPTYLCSLYSTDLVLIPFFEKVNTMGGKCVKKVR
ncbi:MAG: hypothetical protein EWV40_21300 [Microcystis flos-aquae Mf_WU_F_19750830_S460]|uniref:Uncharacterized protein n=1 Tax=Microcystis flos-aquae Mf_WU_F_19750830_S460 TaxID=2486237 RepID=A0A552L5W3_9CHRO|nr:MAG: hypothetical protein EWV40_21300 [Microcystis flos-aquae Mf_WU_F_19750830_S460]